MTKPVAMSTTSIQIVTWKYYLPTEWNQDSLEKWLSLGLGQEKFKMSLEHLVITDNKAIIRDS